MGTCVSQPELPDSIADPDFLLAKLRGHVHSTDYLARSRLALLNNPTLSIPPLTPSTFIPKFDQSFKILQNLSEFSSNKIFQLSDKSFFISSIVDVGDVNSEMFDWWIRECQTSDKFRWAHPKNNVNIQWEEPFRSDSTLSYLNLAHISTMDLANKQYQFIIQYLDPSKYIPNDLIQMSNVSLVLLTRIFILHPTWGEIHLGYNLRLLQSGQNEDETGGTAQPGSSGSHLLRSYFWLGDVSQVLETHKQARSAMLNTLYLHTSLGRSLLCPLSLVEGWFQHSQEEGSCLKSFLPPLFFAHHDRTSDPLYWKHVFSPTPQLLPTTSSESPSE